MRIFVDTADSAKVSRLKQMGIIEGVTTNPTHLSTVGGGPVEVVKRLCEIMGDGPVSVEVTEREPEKVLKQARAIAALSKNIVVKIPCHSEYYPVIATLVKEGIKVNVTLVFSLMQAFFVAKLGVAYISPFMGRLEDIDSPGLPLVLNIQTMKIQYGFGSIVLAASVRSVAHMHELVLSGIDAATAPAELLEKMTQHPLTDKGIEMFLADWAQLGIKTFP